MKLKFTIVVEQEVAEKDLPGYESSTIEEAAKKQQAWIDEGAVDLGDIVGWGEDAKVKVEAIP